MQQLYTLNFTILRAQTDIHVRSRPDVLQMHMQEAAGRHDEALGVRLDGGAFWVLVRLRMSMLRYPAAQETYEMQTAFAGMDGPFYMRSYRMLDAGGSEIGRGSAAWLVLGRDTRRVSRLPRLEEQLAAQSGPLPMEPLKKIRAKTDALEPVLTRRACYSDIDLNGHVNNTRYAAWVCDCFPIEHHQRYMVESLYIQFLQEIRPGEDVELLRGIEGGQDYVLGSVDGQKRFEALVSWRER